METNDSQPVAAFSRKGAASGKGGRPESSRSLPSVVISVRDAASSWLFARMKELMSAVDDTLFSAAEKVYTQSEQDGLFQALRILRLERDKLINHFVCDVKGGFFVAEYEPKEKEDGDCPDEQTWDGLSLVQNDDLEQQVAVKTIVANVKRDLAEPVAELCLRLDTVLPVKVYDENMPIGPAALCRAFQKAIQPLDIHQRARLMVYKKFEQVVAKQLGSLYKSCNQILIEKGILPNLKDPLRQYRQSVRRYIPTGPATQKDSTGERSTTAAAGPISGAGNGNGNGNGLAPGLVPVSAGLVPMATPDLLQHLGALQLMLPLRTGTEGELLNIGSLLQERLVKTGQSASLHEMDSEVIRMVDMLFSFMLEDRNLAMEIKVQLIRLQLPMLKLAVADKTFFSKTGHPARKLLNELADAAIGWQPTTDFRQDALYLEIRQVVEHVLRDFDKDENVFGLLLESFREFIARERKRAALMERRTVEEAEGSARVSAAKARVTAVFDALTAERELPKVVQHWLYRVWGSVLFRTCVKEGTDSDSWHQNVLTARDLVWSAVAPMPESSIKMQRLLPGLRRRLEMGARSLSLSLADREKLMNGLDALYRERQALAERVESERERRTRERLVQELRREANAVVPIPDIEPDETELPEGEPALPKVEELQKVAESASPARIEEPGPLADSDCHWRQTYHLKDSWFLLQRQQEAPVRCRLAAIIQDLDQFMFVNRDGVRVAVYTRLELANALREEKLTPLEEGPLFDRALEYVVGNLKETKIAVTLAEESAAPQ